jgi:hypothetical protein
LTCIPAALAKTPTPASAFCPDAQLTAPVKSDSLKSGQMKKQKLEENLFKCQPPRPCTFPGLARLSEKRAEVAASRLCWKGNSWRALTSYGRSAVKDFSQKEFSHEKFMGNCAMLTISPVASSDYGRSFKQSLPCNFSSLQLMSWLSMKNVLSFPDPFSCPVG